MKYLHVYGDASKNAFNDWLASYGFYIAFALATVVFFVVLGLFIYTFVKEKKNGPVLTNKNQPKVIKNEPVLKALGGEENIVDHSLNGSRIILVLNDYDKVNVEELRELGVSSVVKMSNKITLVIKGDASHFYKSLF